MSIVVAAAAAKRFQSSPREDDGCIVEGCHGNDVIEEIQSTMMAML